MRKIYYSVIFVIALLHGVRLSAQICDPTTPVFTANLSGNPNGTWLSPSVRRVGDCCTATNPDKCIEFIITLDSAAVGINFNIATGAIPPGALYYQVNCGAPVMVGQPICLNGPGPHLLTFCKPGNNQNSYSISSFAEPNISVKISDIASPQCTAILSIQGQGLNQASITWTSVPFNPVYNSYLSCTTGCDSVIVTPSGNFPPYVDYMVCANSNGVCVSGAVCDTIRVHFISDVSVTVSPNNITLCNGVSTTAITATASGGSGSYQYLWSNGQTSPGINAGAGTYSVTVSDTGVCSTATGTATIIVVAPIAAFAGNDVTVCANQPSVNLNGSIQTSAAAVWKGGSGTFSPNNTTLNAIYTPSASEIANGFADLILETTSNQGCPPGYDTIHITIVQPPSPSVNGNSVACANSTGTYSATLIAGCTYAWSVTGGTINGPSNSNSINVTWGGASSGTVSVTVTNSSGCSATVTKTVSIPALPNPVVTGSNSICQNTTSTYSITSSPGDTYTWTAVNGTIVGSNFNSSVQVNWNSTGNGSITVVETNSSGCSQSYTLPVTVFFQPVASISGSNTACSNSTTNYSVALMAGCSYTWTVNGGTINGSSNSNSINVTWTGTGSGTISVTVTTASGCSASATQNVSLIVLPNPVVAGSNTTCRNTSSAYSVNGTAGSSYAWSTVNGTITGSNSNSTVQVNWNTTGSGSVTVVETNSLGCSQSFTLPVTIFQQPVPSVSGNSIACVNNTAFTYTSPWYNNTTYTWSVSGGTIASTNGSNTVNVLWNSPGANYVSLTVSNSVCDSTIMFPVNVGSINPPTAQANTTSGCSPLSVVFSGNNPTAGQTYSWTFGDQLYSSSANPAHTYTIPGVYNLVLFTQNNGCRDSASATIRVFDAPRAAFIHNFEDSVYIIGESILKITNRTTGGTSWFWTFGSNDTSNAFEPKHSYITPGEYLIRLLTVNADGCVDTAERPIRVRDRETIYIPNAFTPNGDNTNDYFSMLSTNIESASVTIFNRWGQIIYTADNKDFKWDGTYFGKPAELGVYVYKINAVGEGGSSYALIGTVSLMR